MPASVIHGDCMASMRAMCANSIDAVVTDPPYELNFMNRSWDSTGIAFDVKTWAEAYRVLKPGGHLVAFGASRNSHRMTCAIEDAGFEIRDSLIWLFGTGFPKSLNISKALGDHPDAARWAGYGSALKPAHEPIVLARKPLDNCTIAANVLKHGTGGINIDACRIGATKDVPASGSGHRKMNGYGFGAERGDTSGHDPNIGRFPANVLHDGSDEVMAAFAAFGEKDARDGTNKGIKRQVNCYGSGWSDEPGHSSGRRDTGTAARFFYSAKADKADRADSKHPTVKPLALMEWLVKLITPPDGLVLDPFAGSGITAEACMKLGFDCTLIDIEAGHVADIQHRIKRWSGLDAPLFAEPAA